MPLRSVMSPRDGQQRQLPGQRLGRVAAYAEESKPCSWSSRPAHSDSPIAMAISTTCSRRGGVGQRDAERAPPLGRRSALGRPCAPPGGARPARPGRRGPGVAAPAARRLRRPRAGRGLAVPAVRPAGWSRGSRPRPRVAYRTGPPPVGRRSAISGSRPVGFVVVGLGAAAGRRRRPRWAVRGARRRPRPAPWPAPRRLVRRRRLLAAARPGPPPSRPRRPRRFASAAARSAASSAGVLTIRPGISWPVTGCGLPITLPDGSTRNAGCGLGRMPSAEARRASSCGDAAPAELALQLGLAVGQLGRLPVQRPAPRTPGSAAWCSASADRPCRARRRRSAPA